MGWRTVRPRGADSPAQIGGQSATVPESLQRLWWAGGQSGPGGRTVRHCFSILYQKGCLSGVGFKVELRTVRPWGADGPQANLKVVPETMLVSGGVELLTADGPPLGRGRSARA